MSPSNPRKNSKSAALAPNDADAKIHCDEASGHLKAGNYFKALQGYNQALELNPNDRNALVARSKCYLLLGEPHLALQDAETALEFDKSFIRGIFQKAEALYHLGEFEHSLMFYHRGQRIRPELEGFRLGVQKAQEAIENTIGGKTLQCVVTKPPSPGEVADEEVVTDHSSKRSESSRSRSRTRSQPGDRRTGSSRFLGDLGVDKQYLEQLLTHPDLSCTNHESSAQDIVNYAKDGINFLNTREEFWRQQLSTNNGQKKIKKH